MYYQSDSVQLKDIHSKFGSKSLISFPITSIFNHKIWLPYIKKIKVVSPLNYIDYNKSNAINTLINKYKWQPYPQKHFESRFTRFYEGYWLPKKFGFDTRKVQYSSLILTGQMTRKQALEKLKEPALNKEDIQRELDYVANKLEISTKELQDFFTTPKRSYKDYKSQKFFYFLGAYVMKGLGLELGGKR
jgi:hypothetical protein